MLQLAALLQKRENLQLTSQHGASNSPDTSAANREAETTPSARDDQRRHLGEKDKELEKNAQRLREEQRKVEDEK